MKMMKLIYPLAFALAVTLTTGCNNHKNVPITPMRGPAPTPIPDQTNSNTLPYAPPYNPDDGIPASVTIFHPRIRA